MCRNRVFLRFPCPDGTDKLPWPISTSCLESERRMSWIYLAIAIVSEITATTTLKATDSFTRLWPSVLVIAGVVSSLYFFSLCVRSLNVAIAYSIWSGVGVTAITVLAWRIYGQTLDTAALAGIALIVTGVIIINLYSQTIHVVP